MAGPENTGDTEKNENDDEVVLTPDEDEKDLRIEEPQEAVVAGFTAEQIGLNARPQAELTDPTRVENFAGAPVGQTIRDEIDSNIPGYASGHDSLVSQKEQYDVALSGASKGRHAGTIFDRICAEKKFHEEQKKRDIQMAAIMNLQDLTNYAHQLSELYEEVEEQFDAVGAKVAEIEEKNFDEKIEEVDQEIEKQQQIIDDLKTRMENGEMNQEMMVRLDTAEAQMKVLQDVRTAIVNEQSALVEDYRTAREEFDQNQARVEELREQIRTAKPGERAALQEET